MTIPDWQQQLTALQAIGEGRPLPPTIALTIAHLDTLLGQCGGSAGMIGHSGARQRCGRGRRG